MRMFRATFAALAVLTAGPALADVEAGLAAYEAGDYPKALAELRASADAGDADAQWLTGNMLIDGQGVAKPDPKTAAVYYRKAAEQGQPSAQLALGTLLRTGNGVPRHMVNAIYWLEKAAIAGHPVAQLDLGDIFQTGEAGSDRRSDVLAVKWYTLAAHQGLPEAQAKLGQLTIEGMGTLADPAEGLMWLMLAERHAKDDAKAKYHALWVPLSKALGPIVRAEAEKRAEAWEPDVVAIKRKDR